MCCACRDADHSILQAAAGHQDPSRLPHTIAGRRISQSAACSFVRTLGCMATVYRNTMQHLPPCSLFCTRQIPTRPCAAAGCTNGRRCRACRRRQLSRRGRDETSSTGSPRCNSHIICAGEHSAYVLSRRVPVQTHVNPVGADGNSNQTVHLFNASATSGCTLHLCRKRECWSTRSQLVRGLRCC